MLHNPTGPTLLGFDVIWVGTVLAGVAAIAVMLASYRSDRVAWRGQILRATRPRLAPASDTSGASWTR